MKPILQRTLILTLTVGLCSLVLGARPTGAFPTCGGGCMQGQWFGAFYDGVDPVAFVSWNIGSYPNNHFTGRMTVFDGVEESSFDLDGTLAASDRVNMVSRGEAGMILTNG